MQGEAQLLLQMPQPQLLNLSFSWPSGCPDGSLGVSPWALVLLVASECRPPSTFPAVLTMFVGRTHELPL